LWAENFHIAVKLAGVGSLRSSPLGFCGKPRRQPTLIEMDHVKIYEDEGRITIERLEHATAVGQRYASYAASISIASGLQPLRSI
jgi:hypothetical protein